MNKIIVTILLVIVNEANCDVQQAPVPGRPQFDDKPIYSDSYLPASMQVIAYLTDLMKFDISSINKPQKPLAPVFTTTTTTVRPTRPHKPGLYAPEQAPLSSTVSSKISALDSTKPNLSPSDNRLSKDLAYLNENPKKILEQINRVDNFDYIGEPNEFVVEDFGKNYDDDFNEDFLRAPRQPPTRAYVTLLSLYDLLNKESKRQGLNKFSGYSKTVLHMLAATSTGSAADQLKFVLSKMMEQQDSKRSDANTKVKALLDDLDKADSAISNQIRYYPPLKFFE